MNAARDVLATTVSWALIAAEMDLLIGSVVKLPIKAMTIRRPKQSWSCLPPERWILIDQLEVHRSMQRWSGSLIHRLSCRCMLWSTANHSGHAVSDQSSSTAVDQCSQGDAALMVISGALVMLISAELAASASARWPAQQMKLLQATRYTS